MDLTMLYNGIPLYAWAVLAVVLLALVAALWVGLGRAR